MMVSTKGRYALTVMVDLAKYSDGGYVSLADIAERENLSMKYLESIISILNKGGMLKSLRGKKGGYMLARSPEEYSINEILLLTEGTLAPVMRKSRDLQHTSALGRSRQCNRELSEYDHSGRHNQRQQKEDAGRLLSAV